MISLEAFLDLSTPEVADLVRASGSKIVVFPINGTRRWFLLEHGLQKWDDPVSAYMDIAAKKHIQLYRLIFEHGIDTLLTPVIGPEILTTRDKYMQKIGAEGLARLATHKGFLSFYDEFDVRVRFYGDYRKHLAGTAYEYLSDTFKEVGRKTKHHKTFRLFFGAFADQVRVTETVAEFAIRYHQKHGKAPDRKAVVEMYYGEYLEKADIFIGFDRFAAFDYPLLNWGGEDLYFTVAPSLYMTERQLRKILYDHLYPRRAGEVEYLSETQHSFQALRSYYRNNALTTLGTGYLIEGVWIPNI